MTERPKKFVAFCLVMVWLFLSSYCFAEKFGFFQGNPEHEDQSIEKVLASPADNISPLNDLTRLLNPFGSSASVLNYCRVLPLTILAAAFPFLFFMGCYSSPGKRKLTLLSQFRI
jgi:hypothetical protein